MDRYPIVDPDHAQGLDQLAAIHEFQHKMPRHQAEKSAYDQYRKEQVEDAAAHHFAGMQAAHGAGDMDNARKHGVMYSLAVKQLGGNPVGDPPKEVMTKVKNNPPEVYRFKAHKGDAYTLPPEKPEEPAA
jgi:hypothetical protein